jgi:hypothetical protein
MARTYRAVTLSSGKFLAELTEDGVVSFSSREFDSERETEGWIAMQKDIDRRADAFVQRCGRPQPRRDDK